MATPPRKTPDIDQAGGLVDPARPYPCSCGASYASLEEVDTCRRHEHQSVIWHDHTVIDDTPPAQPSIIGYLCDCGLVYARREHVGDCRKIGHAAAQLAGAAGHLDEVAPQSADGPSPGFATVCGGTATMAPAGPEAPAGVVGGDAMPLMATSGPEAPAGIAGGDDLAPMPDWFGPALQQARLEDTVDQVAKAMWHRNLQLEDRGEIGLVDFLPWEEEKESLRQHWRALAVAGLNALAIRLTEQR